MGSASDFASSSQKHHQGYLDPEIRGGGGGSKKIFFQPFKPQFGLKISGVQAPRAPPVDPPLTTQIWVVTCH